MLCYVLSDRNSYRGQCLEDVCKNDPFKSYFESIGILLIPFIYTSIALPIPFVYTSMSHCWTGFKCLVVYYVVKTFLRMTLKLGYKIFKHKLSYITGSSCDSDLDNISDCYNYRLIPSPCRCQDGGLMIAETDNNSIISFIFTVCLTTASYHNNSHASASSLQHPSLGPIRVHPWPQQCVFLFTLAVYIPLRRVNPPS